MRSTRITDNEELDSIKGQYLAKLEDIAMKMFTETGVQMVGMNFHWTKTEIRAEDQMNEMGDNEWELQVKVSEPQFK